MDQKFITFEGGEGCGKSTQLALFKERFAELFPGESLITTREPGGSPFAERVRELILSDSAKDLDGMGAFYAFALARHDHIKKVIRPALNDGKMVLCDRFVGATYAYQACAMENPLNADDFRYYYEGLAAKPAVTVVFDIDPVIAAERLSGRTAGGAAYNHFDRRPLEFHQKIREGYLALGNFMPTCVIDAARSKEEIFEEVVACVRGHLA